MTSRTQSNSRTLKSRNQREGWYTGKFLVSTRSHNPVLQLRNYVNWLKRTAS